MTALPPKPASRPEKVSLWRYARLFRRDILSAQPEKLYRAWMAEFRTPFFHSFMVNDPALIRLLLKERPRDFPKSDRVGEGLRPLLANSVFLTNGATWERQRRIIDPAFAGGRLRQTHGAMLAASEAAAERIAARAGEEIDLEPLMSHAAADVIFRALFSVPIDTSDAAQTCDAFRRYQRLQPILNPGAFLRLPVKWPLALRPRAWREAARIRRLIRRMTNARHAQIIAGTAPADLATQIMTTEDPQTGDRLDPEEMIDQIAIFFLAGHETSAATMAWALYLLALYPDWQDRLRKESLATDLSRFDAAAGMRLTRNVLRETLRLYPPVPMMVREATQAETFRGRAVPRGSQIVLSPWHLHRHARLWEAPDAFDPGRWAVEAAARCPRDAYMPFSAGPRICPGAGFALHEATLMLAQILRAVRLETGARPPPVPVAHLTVRSKSGIWVKAVRR